MRETSVKILTALFPVGAGGATGGLLLPAEGDKGTEDEDGDPGGRDEEAGGRDRDTGGKAEDTGDKDSEDAGGKDEDAGGKDEESKERLLEDVMTTLPV
ncbi:hypothetical protein PHLCEN_2v8188 [Hermanssonia centrifuga]|uniref:Uncharacterized protein n=1 Tax=Hermanssonia centrifuga TaxID=98765 RepID=A0A2R6NUD7_9APHY|nr:hypothetical protein PHLCEN_2v8188 [Hermanssonia centrifuga]